jgi:hypothetical protein
LGIKVRYERDPAEKSLVRGDPRGSVDQTRRDAEETANPLIESRLNISIVQ